MKLTVTHAAQHIGAVPAGDGKGMQSGARFTVILTSDKGTEITMGFVGDHALFESLKEGTVVEVPGAKAEKK